MANHRPVIRAKPHASTHEGDVQLSVILPSRNSGRFLRQTLQSIEAQTFDNFECIFIDGQSTDGSLKIAEDFPWVKVLSEPDKGYHDAFLKGLARARGQYITQCCVSDGYLSPNWFEIAVNTLRANPDCDLVWGYPRYMEEDGTLGPVSFPELRVRPSMNRRWLFYHYLAFGFHLPENNYVVTRSAMLEYLPQRPGCSAHELPFDQWLEFENNFHEAGRKTIRVPLVVSFGRQHRGSITDNEREQNERNYRRFQERRLETKRTHLKSQPNVMEAIEVRVMLGIAICLGGICRVYAGTARRLGKLRLLASFDR